MKGVLPETRRDGEDMDGEMGFAGALGAMTADDGCRYSGCSMFSALPGAPVDEALSTREQIVDRIRRLVRRVRTGRTEVGRDRAGLDPTPCSESRVRHKTRRATASITGVSPSPT
jgi:hypothetical protein